MRSSRVSLKGIRHCGYIEKTCRNIDHAEKVAETWSKEFWFDDDYRTFAAPLSIVDSSGHLLRDLRV